MQSFDYIIVGGGSAGCVLAERLTQNQQSKVLLIESGPRDSYRFIHIPAGLLKVSNKADLLHIYESEPEPHMNRRTNTVQQGNVLGGGSSVNAMVYIRGQAQDYDDWSALGCKGWSYEDVLPVFREMENNQRLSDNYHGTQGELFVSDRGYGHPLCWAFIRAAQEAGLPYQQDFNGVRQEGAGYYQTTTHKGRRASAAATFLRKALSRPNLTVMTGTQVDSVRIEDGRAIGVDLQDGRRMSATREVVLTAGALATPKLLMQSGIGPANHLRDLGITVHSDVPGVGENYHDHLETTVQVETVDPISLFGQDKGLRAVAHMAHYMMFRAGLLTSTVVEAGGFVDTEGSGRPDVQFHVLPALAGSHDRPPIAAHGLSINPCHLRPRSRGTVRLRSSHPNDKILFNANAFSVPGDIDALVRATEVSMRIARQPSLRSIIKKRVLPVEGIENDPKALREFVINNSKTVYHPAGTARMGATDDAMAVLDPQLRVRGIRGLRVADASAFPVLPSGNTNAPTMMVAARAAEFLIGTK